MGTAITKLFTLNILKFVELACHSIKRYAIILQFLNDTPHTERWKHSLQPTTLSLSDQLSLHFAYLRCL